MPRSPTTLIVLTLSGLLGCAARTPNTETVTSRSANAKANAAPPPSRRAAPIVSTAVVEQVQPRGAVPWRPSPLLELGVVTTPAPGVPCYTGRALAAGETVLVFEEGQQAVARLVATGLGCPDEPGDRQLDAALWHRSGLRGSSAAVALLATGVATSDKTVRVMPDDGVDLDGDGTAETFLSCTSREGVHLTVWSGNSPDGEQLWHSYVALGYDTVATCGESASVPGPDPLD